MQPAVSIIIPVHDQAPRLRLTLATLEHQAGFAANELEVIVVDDGSSDGVWELVTQLQIQAPYQLRLLDSNSRGCRGVPRNTGAQTARGDVLIFLDADACVSDQFVTRHLDAHSAKDVLALGDFFVVRGTEYLLDPGNGTRFPGVDASVLKNASVPPLTINSEELRDNPDQVLSAHAEKGAYPDLQSWHRNVESMLAAAHCDFKWIGMIPHNLSIARDTFLRLGGFDPFLRHSEGWDLGIRAGRAGCTLTWAPGAKSYHLYHWRQAVKDRENYKNAQRVLLERYPGGMIEAGLLWSASHTNSPSVPHELNLANWRVVQRCYEDPASRAELIRLYRMHETSISWQTTMEYLLGAALNVTSEHQPATIHD